MDVSSVLPRTGSAQPDSTTGDGPEDLLVVDAQHGAGPVVLRLSGEVSAYTTPALREVLVDLGSEHLVIDLREVDRIDASGLSFLVSTTETRRDRGALTGLVAEGGLHELLGYTRLSRAALVCPTVDAVLDSMPEICA